MSVGGLPAPKADATGHFLPHAHSAQFYEDDAFLLDELNRYIGPALVSGDVAIVIATAAHQEALAARLRQSGVNLDAVRTLGRYIALDAADTLAKLMVDGWPDATRFAEHIGGVMDQATAAAAHGRITAFGEMVALLWHDGNPEAAIRLEELWSELAGRYSFQLHCAYPMSLFSTVADCESMARVCAAHSAVLPAETYGSLVDDQERLRAVARLQQKAVALETEIERRRQVERALEAEIAEHQRTVAELHEAVAVRDQDIAARELTEMELRERTREVAQRTLSLEALYRADEELHRSLRLDDVLESLVDVAAQVLRADKSAVHVWSAQRAQLEVAATRGIAADTIPLMTYELGHGVVGRVGLARESIALEDVANEAGSVRQAEDREGIRSCLTVPIVFGGDLFGVFTVGYTQRRTFDANDDRLLNALARRAAHAIENARLYERAKQGAVLEERQRLARDLHDAVTQTLFAASLIAEVVPGLWERSQEEGERRLAELRQLTRGALAEMRTLLLELRPEALTDMHLGDLLRQLADAFGGRARVPIDVTVEEAVSLTPDVEIALYRIAQEALNNVFKHANASRVRITLTGSPEQTELCVQDNGRGFDPDAALPGHMGMGVMQERAQSIGAALRLHSVVGQGTEVRVILVRRHPE